MPRHPRKGGNRKAVGTLGLERKQSRTKQRVEHGAGAYGSTAPRCRRTPQEAFHGFKLAEI
jgi:hypothetical protein